MVPRDFKIHMYKLSLINKALGFLPKITKTWEHIHSIMLISVKILLFYACCSNLPGFEPHRTLLFDSLFCLDVLPYLLFSSLVIPSASQVFLMGLLPFVWSKSGRINLNEDLLVENSHFLKSVFIQPSSFFPLFFLFSPVLAERQPLPVEVRVDDFPRPQEDFTPGPDFRVAAGKSLPFAVPRPGRPQPGGRMPSTPTASLSLRIGVFHQDGHSSPILPSNTGSALSLLECPVNVHLFFYVFH